MKKYLIAAACSLSFVWIGCGESAQTVPPVQSADFTAYIAVQEALAGDHLDEARMALADLQEHGSEEIAMLASQAAAADEIEALRSAFIAISDQMAKGEIPQGYGLAFCPMANEAQGAHWIQKKGTVMNPYFGGAMLHCGVFKDDVAEQP